MQNAVKQIRAAALQEISRAHSLNQLEHLRIVYLGRKGKLTILLKQIPKLGADKRARIGKLANAAKNQIAQALTAQQELLRIRQPATTEWIDVTAPGKRPPVGHIHPVTQIVWELSAIFAQMGYEIMEGPEVETEYYNFTVLNIPQHHPARDLQDTFWLTNGLLPRTHTSAMQVRVMEKRRPPFKIAIPGRVFRSEREDATHAATFYQYEAFAVGSRLAFSDLKGTLYAMLQKILGTDIQLKFRASYFPYVEPCAEISASCPRCKGKGCKACAGSGWLEILGAGMIHPLVLQRAKINPDKYNGFAFSFGPTRLAMIKYAIDDIRLFTSGDLRFLWQF